MIIRSLLNLVLYAGALFAPVAHADLAQKPAVQQFIAQMVKEHGFSRPKLEKLFSEAVERPEIVRAISRPAESKPWYQYRPIFLTESRIRQGVEFWRAHAATLARAQKVYGVPPQMVVAILGVETRYGRHTGSYRVIDALSTLAFDYPPRSAFFRKQLVRFLLMTREEHIDPLSLRGSYAGAMGKAQFIPSSYRRYAVDFDHDGHRDLWRSADAIGSVANYFHVHGWQPGGAIARRAEVSGDRFEALLTKGIEPSVPVDKLSGYGVHLGTRALAPGQPAALLELHDSSAPEYWVTLHNFYVITRYNHSPLYAMAVYQLGKAIRERYQHALETRSVTSGNAG